MFDVLRISMALSAWVFTVKRAGGQGLPQFPGRTQ
jgi:hypothetical protein